MWVDTQEQRLIRHFNKIKSLNCEGFYLEHFDTNIHLLPNINIQSSTTNTQVAKKKGRRIVWAYIIAPSTGPSTFAAPARLILIPIIRPDSYSRPIVRRELIVGLRVHIAIGMSIIHMYTIHSLFIKENHKNDKMKRRKDITSNVWWLQRDRRCRVIAPS